VGQVDCLDTGHVGTCHIRYYIDGHYGILSIIIIIKQCFYFVACLLPKISVSFACFGLHFFMRQRGWRT